MRWAKQSTIARPKEWKEWMNSIQDVREGCAMTWMEYGQQKEMLLAMTVKECKTCQWRCKIAVDYATFGRVLQRTDGEEHCDSLQ